MKRAFAWLAGLVGIAALGRLLARRRSATRPEAEPVAGPPDPAAELRDRLAAQRAADPVPEPTTRTTGSETLEERRARIHAEAQEAIEAMREPSS